MDDSIDSSGRLIPGAQTFVRGLFASAESAQRALDDYRKRNPKANSSTDEYLQKLETQAAQAQQNAQGGSRWAVMSPSARGAVLTHGRLQSEYANIRENTKRLAAEQKEAEAAAGKEVVGSNGLVYKTPNLYDDAKYFEQTGVLRGGAGLGTSVTPGGGVIRDAMLDDSDPKNALSKRVLESKYGSGSMIRLPDEALAKRPQSSAKTTTRFGRSAAAPTPPAQTEPAPTPAT